MIYVVSIAVNVGESENLM